MSRLDAPLGAGKGAIRPAYISLPCRRRSSERLAARGLEGSIRLAFDEPAPAGAEIVDRSHPLPAILAEALLEGALDPGSSAMTAAWPRRGLADPGVQDADHRGAAAPALQTDGPWRGGAAAAGRGGQRACLRGRRARAPRSRRGSARNLLEHPARRRSRPGRAGAAARAGPRADRSHAVGCRSQTYAAARAEASRETMRACGRRASMYRASASSRCCRPMSSASIVLVPAGV